MSLLDWLKSLGEDRQDSQTGTESVRRIAAELDRLDPARARYLAAFAYILGRAARADLRVSETETARMITIVQRVGDLPQEQAALVVEIAKAQNRLLGGTEDFLVTREFREISTAAQRRELLDCLFATAASDEGISTVEESQIRQIASELGFAPDEYIAVRLAWSDQRTILRGFRTNR